MIPKVSLRVVCTLVVTVLYFSMHGFSQAPNTKFGKIEIPDLQQNTYEKDSSAAAVVLFDVGNARFSYNQSKGDFQVIYERHCRIKILKKSGYDNATVVVPLWHSSNSSDKEDFYDLKGVTYNLENGQVIKEKLNKDAVFTDKVSENRTKKRFTFPKVKEGSIIEYSYTITSDFYYNFRDWQFQREIPTVWSEFSVNIPEYFEYRKLSQGYEPFVLNTKESGTMSITLSSSGGVSKTGTVTQGTTETLNVRTDNFRWAMQHVPALKEEPFITTINDYVASLEFELSYTKFPNAPFQQYAATWQSLNQTLLKNDYFGGALSKSNFLNEVVKNITSKTHDTLTKVAMAVAFIKQNMTWDEHNTIYVTSSLKKAFEAKKGNVADINLMLVVLLRELGFKANPVILSTRSNGRLLEDHVLLSRFNYVVAHIDLNGNDLLLDATTTECPLGILPMRCLNGEGRLINEQETRWISLAPSQGYRTTLITQLEISKEGNLKGNVNIATSGYDAIRFRQSYKELGKTKFLEDFTKKHGTWTTNNLDVENINDLDKDAQITSNVEISEACSVAGDKIYFKPIFEINEQENPFNNPNRKFPVDFGSGIERVISATYTLPEGYTVEEMPKNAKINLPDGAGTFIFLIGLSEDKKQLMLNSRLSLRKSVYYAEEYPYLSKFYDMIIAKQAEQIVLKKSNP